MANGDVPLVVCVSADLELRKWIVQRIDRRTPVLVCTDLDELRATLFPAETRPAGEAPRPAGGAAEPAAAVSHGEFVVDVDGHQVTWRGGVVATTRRERELLARLARPPLAVWPYEKLFVEVWGGSYLGDSSILHSAVKRLRRKLRGADGAPGIETVRGVGYRLSS
ncbi:winged helix-turn-helix domain-containing protein [Micromonospora sp. CPCC 206061]|uniref:winged helix-turn-helix domain-containing protein n=1 Tax=Micromonospora sp. CPCC 206061 TaxID=3122410 RepID=UPI002FF3A954